MATEAKKAPRTKVVDFIMAILKEGAVRGEEWYRARCSGFEVLVLNERIA
jgi:hypothetical protein